jgi:hypothetical protein
MTNPKLCINCKNFIKNNNLDNKYGKCKAFPKIKEDDEYLITGNKINVEIDYHYCSTARNSRSLCDEIGRKYEKK